MTEHLIDRPVQITPCPVCSRHLLVAIDGGLTVACDPDSLNIHAEIAAILGGRGSYDLVPETGRKAYLYRRGIFRIRAGRKYTVVARHACPSGLRPVISWRIPEKKAVPKTRKPAAVIHDTTFPF